MGERNGRLDDAVADLGFPQLPGSWCWATVGDVGEVRLGRQRSPKNRSKEHPTKYMRAANITWEGIDLSDVLDMEFTRAEQEVFRLIADDIILSEASGSPHEVGKPAIWRDQLENCCFQNTVIRFRSAVTAPGYAHTIFSHFARNGVFARVSKGVNINHLSAARFATIPFPVAPRMEQERIADKVEELFSDLDAGVAALQRVRANLKRYRASVLKSAVEGRLTEAWRSQNPPKEPASELLARILKERRRRWQQQQLATYKAKGKKPPKEWQSKYKEPDGLDASKFRELPKGWCWASVDQLAEVGTGTTPRRGISTYWEKGTIPWVTSTAVNELYVTQGNELVNEAALKDTHLTLYPSGTLIVALYGEGKTRGKVSELRIEATINQALAALQMKGPSALCRAYLKLFLLSNYDKLRRGSAGGVQPNLNLGLVRRIQVPLPPLEEQEEIATAVEEKMSILDQTAMLAGVNLARANRLRQSILKRAFEGTLVAQDPKDEPASIFLKRIHSDHSTARSRNAR